MAAGSAHDRAHGGGAVLLPCFRFTHSKADIKSQQRRSATGPEHGAPSPRGKDEARSHRGEQIADGISALHDSGENSAPLRRSALHGERRSHSPLTAHADAVDGAQNQKDRIARGKSAQQFDDAKRKSRSPSEAGGVRSGPPAIRRRSRPQDAWPELQSWSRRWRFCSHRNEEPAYPPERRPRRNRMRRGSNPGSWPRRHATGRMANGPDSKQALRMPEWIEKWSTLFLPNGCRAREVYTGHRSRKQSAPWFQILQTPSCATACLPLQPKLFFPDSPEK